MLNLNDCPHLLDYPTFDGVRVEPETDLSLCVAIANGLGDHARHIKRLETDPEYAAQYRMKNRKHSAGFAFPVLKEIGLLDALFEVEAVVAWNKTEKHSDCKWKKKGINYHDAKAVKHLGEAQCNASSGLSPNDHETGRSHRAHAACRLLMSLAHELKN